MQSHSLRNDGCFIEEHVQPIVCSEERNTVVEESILSLETRLKDINDEIDHTQFHRVALQRAQERLMVVERDRLWENNEAVYRWQNLTIELHTITDNRANTESKLQSAASMNALNDCFHIWHGGAFGTINGLRLGNFAGVAHTANLPDGIHASTRNIPTQPSFFSFSFFGEHENNKVDSLSASRVPWSEINAALGFVALLLATVEGNPNSGVNFSSFDIVPMGSFSKIVTKVDNGIAPAVYNLFSEDSFQIFGKRNFNAALNGLLKCVLEVGQAVAKRDGAMALPHSVQSVGRGEYAVGGLSISHGSDGERWTRALKYLLTDMKWIIAFMAKHVDR